MQGTVLSPIVPPVLAQSSQPPFIFGNVVVPKLEARARDLWFSGRTPDTDQELRLNELLTTIYSTTLVSLPTAQEEHLIKGSEVIPTVDKKTTRIKTGATTRPTTRPET